MNRRGFLRAAAVAATASALTGCRFTMEQGLLNDCRAPRGHSILRDRLVRAAWDGVDPARVWDCHVHLFGNGLSRTGIYLNPDLDRPANLAGRVRRAMFLNASCGGEDDERFDQSVADRIAHLVDELPAGAKVMLLAFDFTYDADGKVREDLTTFAVSDAFAARVARERPDRFEWIASVHPYRGDASRALESAWRAGARAVKWLPQAMGIDLSHARAVSFYGQLRRLGMPLMVHVGEEQAVEGARRHDLGNPLLLRHPLNAGVRVIASHCASLGESADLDVLVPGAGAPKVPNVDLFARLMADARYQALLVGDLSAIALVGRAAVIPRLIAAADWHDRLLNGSDYPLPGVMPILSLQALVRDGLLPESSVPVLRELRHVNPLAFDFVLKRTLRWKERGFPATVYETRNFFDPGHRRA